MKKLIVPIDFSDCSINALSNAIMIAEKMKLELVVFHAMMAPVGFADGAPVVTMEMGLKTIENKAKADIEDLLKEYPRLDKISHHYEVQYGSLSDLLRSLTLEMDVALIVMGTNGAKGLKKVFLGSNAFHVMKKVKCPVIAIPENADLAQMKHLALAMDYHSIPNHDILTMVNNLSRSFFSELHLVHVEGSEEDDKRHLQVARSLDQYLKSVPHKFHFLHSEDMEGAMTDFALENGIDLLMLVAKHHGLIDKIKNGSHTKNLMLEAPIPLMIFHE